ncbi:MULTISPECIES: hypothetical protein [unclassified Pseudomonas]|uniref:hypothetical protein n=1 Tax=unclassified Pseudomonas TaxID=196821 RepID=UPI000BA45785|nr:MULTISPECIES: hypothetical protein [unclassified Pseudomonas]MCU1725249.1 hypothetical protein [Pseudomonas sp. 5P_5.1_Bac1]
MNTQRLLGWTAFLGVSGALAWAPGFFFETQAPDDSAAVIAAPRSAIPAPKAQAAVRETLKTPPRDLFASKQWKPATVLATVTEQPLVVAPLEVLPVAPALPFQFVGRLDDRDDQRVFLQAGEKLYVVRRGDVIDDTYRIEQISATELSLVYLPMHLSQTLSVGSAP